MDNTDPRLIKELRKSFDLPPSVLSDSELIEKTKHTLAHALCRYDLACKDFLLAIKQEWAKLKSVWIFKQ